MIELENIKYKISESYSLDTKKISLETKISDLGLDSLDSVELLMSLEEDYKVSLEGINYDNTIGDVMKYINENRN